jgi:parallel beta-helix repeat protein
MLIKLNYSLSNHILRFVLQLIKGHVFQDTTMTGMIRTLLRILLLLLFLVTSFAYLTWQGKSEAKVWIVDDDGPADFKTIQEALNNATAGDVINVLEGTYYENVVVTKTGILLQGVGQNVIINGEEKIGIYLEAHNVTVAGFIIRNCSIGVSMYSCSFCNVSRNTIELNTDGLSCFRCSDNIIEKNVFRNTGTAIHIAGSVYASGEVYPSTNNTVRENTIQDNEYGIIFTHAPDNLVEKNFVVNSRKGVVVGFNARVTIRDNNLRNCSHGVSLEDGTSGNMVAFNIIQKSDISIVESSGNTVTNNTLLESTIGLTAADSNVVCGNIISKGETGLYVYNSKHNTLRSNNLTDNRKAVSISSDPYSLFRQTSANLLEDNWIERNEIGVQIWPTSSGNRITRNHLVNNSAGISAAYSANLIYHNDFIGNEDQAWSTGANDWDRNYWSDYKGTDSDNDGIGDQPYTINQENTDKHPLMRPFGTYKDLPPLDLVEREILISIFPEETVLSAGEKISFNVTITNTGAVAEDLKFDYSEGGASSPLYVSPFDRVNLDFSFTLDPRNIKRMVLNVTTIGNPTQGNYTFVVRVWSHVWGYVDPWGPSGSATAYVVVKGLPPPPDNDTQGPTDYSVIMILASLLVAIIAGATIYLVKHRGENQATKNKSSDQSIPSSGTIGQVLREREKESSTSARKECGNCSFFLTADCPRNYPKDIDIWRSQKPCDRFELKTMSAG